MPELSGLLEGVGLAPLLSFLVSQGAGGELSIVDGPLTGVVFIQDGRVIGSIFGEETGIAALEAMSLVLSKGHFTFTDRGKSEHQVNVSLEPRELKELLARIGLESVRVGAAIPSHSAVPLVVTFDRSKENDALVLQRRAVWLLHRLDGRHSVADLAKQYGLRSTMLCIAQLLELGLVRLERPRDQMRVRALERSKPPRSRAPQPSDSDTSTRSNAEIPKNLHWSRWRRPPS